MAENFDDKVMSLNSRILNLQKPASNLEKISKSKESFLRVKHTIEEKIERLEKDISDLDRKVTKYSQKIERKKQSVDNFSSEKNEELIEVLVEWTQKFDERVFKAKNNFKAIEVAASVKTQELKAQHTVLIKSLQEKIKKNLKKVQSQLTIVGKTCSQGQKLIKNCLSEGKQRIQSLLTEHQKSIVAGEARLNHSIQTVNEQIVRKIQILKRKWHQKDKRTQQIFEILLEDL